MERNGLIALKRTEEADYTPLPLHTVVWVIVFFGFGSGFFGFFWGGVAG